MAKHPVPKKKHSKSRRNTRRAHDALSAPTIVDCPECGNKKIPHAVCQQCGSYKGRQVMVISD